MQIRVFGQIFLLTRAEKSKLRLLEITQPKKKGKGSILTEMGYILIYSGKDQTEKAGAGVGIIIHKDFESNISGWKFILERLIKCIMSKTK